MSLTNELFDFAGSRGLTSAWGLFKRAFAPTSTVLEGMGPYTSRLANDLRSVDDMAASGTGQIVSSVLPLERWEKIAPEKRVSAAYAKAGWLTPQQRTQALADPDVKSIFDDITKTATITNQQNLDAVDPLGNPLQVRDPFTGNKSAYQGISQDYFPLFVKRTKRDAILDPIQQVQGKLETQLSQQVGGVLDDAQLGKITETASDAIDDFLRTGQANSILQDKNLLKTLKPAFDNMQEVTQHMQAQAAVQAKAAGTGAPVQIDPILQLFGSPDPLAQKSGMRMFREFLLRDAQNARRFGSIESSRAWQLPKSWYEADPMRVMPVYVMRQQRRLAEIAKFGQDNEAILDPDNGLLRKIPDQGDRDYAKKVFDRAMGLEPYNKALKTNNLLDAAFSTQVLKLGTAQIAQLGQIMNVIMETGLGPTWQALGNLTKSKDIALRSGASLTRVMDIVREGLADPAEVSGPRKFSEDFLKWTGFNKADLLARHIGAGAGYAQGQVMFQRVLNNPADIKALRELRRLIPGAEKDNRIYQDIVQRIGAVRSQIGKKIPIDDVEKYFQPELDGIARTASLNANFRNSILDTPLWASSPLGRLITMFRTFSYKQTLFMKNRAMEDWRDGNPRTLVGLAAGAGLIGPLVTGLKSIPQGRYGVEAEDRQKFYNLDGTPTELTLKGIENIATVGGLGLFDSVLRAMRRGDTGWFEFVAGPLFSDIIKFIGATGNVGLGASGFGEPGQAVKGGRELGRFAAGHVPIVGGGINQALRASLEPVERLESGAVIRPDGRSMIGLESPPLEIAGLTLPAPRVLFGLEPSAYAARTKLLDRLKAAIASEDREQITAVLKEAQANKVKISADSVNRLIRQHLQDKLAAQE